jgi:hypothetical protein
MATGPNDIARRTRPGTGVRPVLLLAACVGLLPSCGRVVSPTPGASAPPVHESEGVVTLESPEEASVELVAAPAEIAPAGRVVLRLHNRGETALSYGRPVQVERWDGEAWVETEESRQAAWTMELLIVQGGQPGVEQEWPFQPTTRAEPGWYRFTKQVQAEPPGDEPRQTAVRARIRVRDP